MKIKFLIRAEYGSGFNLLPKEAIKEGIIKNWDFIVPVKDPELRLHQWKYRTIEDDPAAYDIIDLGDGFYTEKSNYKIEVYDSNTRQVYQLDLNKAPQYRFNEELMSWVESHPKELKKAGLEGIRVETMDVPTPEEYVLSRIKVYDGYEDIF